MRRLLLSLAAVALGLAIVGNADAKGGGKGGSRGGSRMSSGHRHGDRHHRNRRERRYWWGDRGCYCYYYPEWSCYVYWDTSCNSYRPVPEVSVAALEAAPTGPTASFAAVPATTTATATAVATATAGSGPTLPPGGPGGRGQP